MLQPPDALFSSIQGPQNTELSPAAGSVLPLTVSGDGRLNKLDEKHEGHLVVSPYTSLPHLLNLSTVSKSCQLLAKALKGLEPATTDYSTAPYVEAFNWSTVLETLKTSIEAERGFHWEEQFFYIVVFRSQIRPAIDSGYLGARDQASHAEATESGGLLKYWFGYPDKNKRNLATCVWRKASDASVGSIGEAHLRAVRETRNLYSEWKIERFRLTVGEAGKSWEILNWQD